MQTQKAALGYMTKGIKIDGKTGKAPELMYVGDLKFE